MKYQSRYELSSDIIDEVSKQQLTSKTILIGGITGLFVIALTIIAILMKIWWLCIPTVMVMGFGLFLIHKMNKTVKETCNTSFMKGLGMKLKVSVELNDGAIFYTTKFDNKKTIFSYKGISGIQKTKNYFLINVKQKGQPTVIFVRRKDIGNEKEFLQFINNKRKSK